MVKFLLKIDVDTFTLFEKEETSLKEIKRESTGFKFQLESFLSKDEMLKLSNFLNDFLSEFSSEELDIEVSEAYCYSFILPYVTDDHDQISWEIEKRVNDSVNHYLFSTLDRGETLHIALIREEVKDLLFNIIKTLNKRITPNSLLFKNGDAIHKFSEKLDIVDEPIVVTEKNRGKGFLYIILTLLLASMVVVFIYFKDKIIPKKGNDNNERKIETSLEKGISNSDIDDTEKIETDSISYLSEVDPEKPKVAVVEEVESFSFNKLLLQYSDYKGLIVFSNKVIVFPKNLEQFRENFNSYSLSLNSVDQSYEFEYQVEMVDTKFNYVKSFTEIGADELNNYLNQFIEIKPKFKKLIILERNNKLYVKLF